MPSLEIPSSPTSDDGSFVFDSSSDDPHTPNERVSPAIDGAKGVASVGVAVHSPPAMFVGTPFATGPNLFEYPFPPARPALSTTSSISSIASSILGPPSPSTRAKYIPRMTPKSQATSRRRFSGNNPLAVRVPPRLRTDSSGSTASTAEREEPAKPPSRQVSLRDRSGSLGVLPIQLPPPSIATMGLGAPSTGPLSPAALVGVMASTGFGRTLTPGSDEEQCVASGKRRASVPALFAPNLGEEGEDGLDREDVDDHAES